MSRAKKRLDVCLYPEDLVPDEIADCADAEDPEPDKARDVAGRRAVDD